MKKAILTIVFLICSNAFMTLAWYGHLKMKQLNLLSGASLFLIIIVSWGIAFFEYLFQVPANRIGFVDNGGPFSLWQLKVIQEIITLVVFTAFTVIFFKDQPLKVNHLIGFGLLVLAVYFIFRD
jgi:uncharacterized protein